MSYIDFGLAMLSASALTPLGQEKLCGLADVYRRLVHEGRIVDFEVKHRFYEIGSPVGIAETEAHLRRQLAMHRDP